MATGAADLQEIIEAVDEVMDLDKLSAGSGGGWVFERPSCKESVFGMMLAIETMSLCVPYFQYIKYYYCSYQMYQYTVKHISYII